ncbi:hypothetical protein CHUAL_013298 [Chamberlinius hualienensis]
MTEFSKNDGVSEFNSKTTECDTGELSKESTSYGATAITIEDESQPPSYNLATLKTTICRSCRAPLIIPENPRQFHAKCSQCEKSTIIREIPKDRKFTRCTCNALSHKKEAKIVTCSKPECRKIHNLTGKPLYKICCAYCENIFYMRAYALIGKRIFVKCTHCHSVGHFRFI